MKTTKEKRDHLRALLAKSTTLPWLQATHVGEPRAIVSARNPGMSLFGLDKDGMAIVYEEDDADLIAAAVNALTDLLDDVERLHEALQALADASYDVSLRQPALHAKNQTEADEWAKLYDRVHAARASLAAEKTS